MKSGVLKALCLLLLLSCEVPKKSSVRSTSGIENQRWYLVSIGGDTIRMAKQPFVIFVEGRELTGFGGCNIYSGQYVLNNRQLAVSGITSTRMACDSNNPEQKFLQALQQIDGVQLEGRRLKLLKSDFPVMELSLDHP